MFRLLSIVLASTLFVTPASALFIKLPDGTTPTKYQNTTRKVVPQGTKVRNQPWIQRNNQRRLDLKNIGNALAEYRRAANSAPKNILITEEQEICRWDAASCAGLLDLKELLTPCLDAMPADPLAEGNGTGYAVKKDYKERVFLRSLKAEQGSVIRLQH